MQKVANELDSMSQVLRSLANEMWDDAREEWRKGELDDDDYDEVRAAAGSLLLSAVQLGNNVSRRRLAELDGSRAELTKISEALRETKKNIAKAESIVKLALGTVTVVATIVAAVTDPSKIAAAVEASVALGTNIADTVA